ncbi:MAG: alkaline phosphatase family protein [Ktedonobacteraceae bacterium]
MRVLIFGVDGLTFRVLHPMMQNGHLPNFQALVHDGIEAVLESKYPPLTPPGWMSLATGLKPAKHGVYDFWEYDERDGDRLVTRRKGGKAIWNLLSEQGKKVIVVNVPFTYPPDLVNGIMVSGIPGTMRGNFTHPTAFREELLDQIPDYRIEEQYDEVRQGKLTPIQAALHLIEKRIEIMHYLLEKKEWDFAFITFRSTDYLQHLCWEEILAQEPQVMRYYQLLDEALGSARASLGSDGTLFGVSDHGFQGATVKFAMNEFLFRNKWFQSGRLMHRPSELISMLGKQALNQFGLLEQGRRLKNRFYHQSIERVPYLTRQEQMNAGVSMPSSSSIAGSFADLHISRLLSTQEMNDLHRDLMDLTDPTNGHKLIDAIYGTEVFGQGPYQLQEEHLLLLPSEGYTFTPVLGRPWLWEREKRLLGTHQKDGVLYVCGPAIKAGVKGMSAEIYDIVPTVLRVMNLPQPDDLDGGVIEDIFEPARSAISGDKEAETDVSRKLKKFIESS